VCVCVSIRTVSYAEKHKNRRIDDSSSRSHRPQRRRARLISCLAACVCVVLSCLSPTPINYNHLRDFKKPPPPPPSTVVYFYLSGGGAFFHYNVRARFRRRLSTPPSPQQFRFRFQRTTRASMWVVEILHSFPAKPKCLNSGVRG